MINIPHISLRRAIKAKAVRAESLEVRTANANSYYSLLWIGRAREYPPKAEERRSREIKLSDFPEQAAVTLPYRRMHAAVFRSAK